MTVADVAVTPLSDHRTQLRRAVVASTVGTTIEWYDFLLYGQMAAIVFAYDARRLWSLAALFVAPD